MKKLFAFLASALMVLSLAACSNNGGGNNDKPTDDGGAGSGVPDAVPKDPSGSEEPPMDTGRTQPVRTSAPSSQGQDDQGGQDAARDSTAAGTEKTQ